MFHGTRHVIATMHERGGGSTINISSTVGI
ncbi:MAG: hypothetical protein CMQ29_14420 [Gammaproteobacteria bacterium]|nr:hypothetical protein [Gammaproteobacteria bacterium]